MLGLRVRHFYPPPHSSFPSHFFATVQNEPTGRTRKAQALDPKARKDCKLMNNLISRSANNGTISSGNKEFDSVVNGKFAKMIADLRRQKRGTGVAEPNASAGDVERAQPKSDAGACGNGAAEDAGDINASSSPPSNGTHDLGRANNNHASSSSLSIRSDNTAEYHDGSDESSPPPTRRRRTKKAKKPTEETTSKSIGVASRVESIGPW